MVRLARALVVALVLVAVTVALAQLKERPIQVQWVDGRPRVSFSVKDLVDDSLRKELSSGLKKRMVITVQAFASGSNAIIGTRQFACEVTYDLWDDGYRVHIGRRTEKLPTQAKVLQRCLDVKGLLVGEAEQFDRHKGRKIYFAIRAEFNPISPGRCHELLKSGPGVDPIGPVVVNIVRRRICAAQKSLEFRSKERQVPP